MDCKYCQENFDVTKDRQIFCSHKCQARWAISQASLKRVYRSKAGAYKKCVTCNQDFYVRPYRIENPKTKYCSRSCLAKVHFAQYAQHRFKPTFRDKHKYKYIVINGKQVRLHRHIMEEHLGRKLERWEHVHHINDDPSDNRIENLRVLSNADHQRVEVAFRKKITSS
jgi:hypothetical protein